jgi:hypothetical protein
MVKFAKQTEQNSDFALFRNLRLNLACHDARMFVCGKICRQQRNRRNKVVVVAINGVNQRNTYSSGQKFLNDHSIWHNFFVSQPIDLKL